MTVSPPKGLLFFITFLQANIIVCRFSRGAGGGSFFSERAATADEPRTSDSIGSKLSTLKTFKSIRSHASSRRRRRPFTLTRTQTTKSTFPVFHIQRSELGSCLRVLWLISSRFHSGLNIRVHLCRVRTSSLVSLPADLVSFFFPHRCAGVFLTTGPRSTVVLNHCFCPSIPVSAPKTPCVTDLARAWTEACVAREQSENVYFR